MDLPAVRNAGVGDRQVRRRRAHMSAPCLKVGPRSARMTDITSAEFCDRFVALVLGARELPRKPRALDILLLSAILGLDPERVYSEGEVNGELQKWILAFGGGLGLDSATLRRLLVDGRFIRRDPAARSCQVEAAQRISYDPSIRDLDLHSLIADARQARRQRKHDHDRRS